MTACLLLVAAALGAPPSSINPDAPMAVPADEAPTVATGELVFDARLPSELRVDGRTVAVLYATGTFAMQAPLGPHQVVVITNGTARTIDVEVPRTGSVVVMVGRTGLTAGKRGPTLAEDGSVVPLDLRVTGDRDVLVQIGEQRWHVNARGSKAVEVPVGSHAMSVRSGNGTVVWATGTLDLTAAGPVVLQLTEGRMPEVSGVGTAFHPGS